MPGRWSLLACAGCDSVWLSPRPSAEALVDFYEDYFTHAAPTEETRLQRVVHRGIPASFGAAPPDLAPWERRCGRALAWIGPLRELAWQSVMWLEPARRGRLLDVGCGAGHLLARMQSLGWSVHGIEADPAAARIAADGVGVDRVHQGDLCDAPFDAGSFDAVTLFHVLEHVADPGEALARCRALLAPGGRLVLATPNLESLGRRAFGAAWLHWDPPRHLQLYSRGALARLTEDAGLTVKRLFTPSCSALPVWRGSQAIRRRGRVPQLDLSGEGAAQTLVALCFWAWEYLRCRRAPVGEDLVLIAEATA